MSKTYHPKRTGCWASPVALVFWPTVGANAIAFFLFWPDLRGEARVEGATFVGLLAALLSAQAVYEFVAWHLKELTLSADGATKRGVFGETTLRYADVREVRWGRARVRTAELRGEPSGGAEKKVEVEFVGLAPRHALDLIRTLRAHLPNAEHIDWERFCRQYAIPLRDSVNGVKRPLRADERRLTRRRWSVIFAPSIVIGGLVAVGLASFTGDASGFAVVALLAGMWAILHFGWPREGQVVRRRTAEEKKQIWFLGGGAVFFFVGFPVAIPVIEYLLPPPLGDRVALCWFLGVVVAMIALFVWAGSLLAETQKERETVEAFGAAKEWEEGEHIVFIEREN